MLDRHYEVVAKIEDRQSFVVLRPAAETAGSGLRRDVLRDARVASGQKQTNADSNPAAYRFGNNAFGNFATTV